MAKLKYAQERREKIIETFVACLREKDYDEVTMRMIAERSGLSYSCLYYYFKNKDAIMASYFEDICAIYEARIRDIPNLYRAEELSALSLPQLTQLIARRMNTASIAPSIHQFNRTINLTVFLLASRNPDFGAVYKRLTDGIYVTLRDVLLYSSIPVKDIDATVRAISAFMRGLIVYAATGLEDISVEDVIEGML